MSLRISCDVGDFWFFARFGFAAWAIIWAGSKFDLDSTPPLARIFPSGLKDSEVTVRPMVPADIVPIMLVIIAARSAIFGILTIVGIWPRLILPGFGKGLTAGTGNGLLVWPGAFVSACRRLPEARSQRVISPCKAAVAIV